MTTITHWLTNPERVRITGYSLLLGALFFGVVVILAAILHSEQAMLLVMILLAAAAILAWLFKRPDVNLIVVLASVVAAMRLEEGIQLGEALFGLYFLSFLAHWYGTRILRGEKLTEDRDDRAVLLFLILVPASVPLTILFQGSLRTAFSEGVALAMLGFYLPIKDYCSRSDRAPIVIAAVLGWLFLFVAGDKLFAYIQAIGNATQVWQIMRGRVATIEGYLLVPTMFSLVLYLFDRHPRRRIPYAGGFLFFFGMLILSQSRGYWIDFVVGVTAVFLLAGRRARTSMLGIVSAGVLGVVIVAYALFQDLFILLAAGIVERVGTLGSALTQDISLVNRFYESEEILRRILRNPIVGYGMGVDYQVWDLIINMTRKHSFIHNGFLSVWYRFGVLGLGLIVYIWFRAIGNGISTFRNTTAAPFTRILSFAAGISLIALLPSANTSNPFYLMPEVLLFTMLTSLAAGTTAAARKTTPATPS